MAPERHRRTGDGPILVLDPVPRHAVAAVRGLGRAGWEVVVAGSERRSDAIAAWSRYAHPPYVRLPDPHADAEPFERALTQLIRRRRIQAVVAITDATIARLRGLDLGIATVPRLDAGLDRIIDKVELARVCAAAGVMYPRTWSPGSDDVPDAGWPRIVKPRRTAMAGPSRVADHTGAAVVRDPAGLESAVAALRGAGLEPIVQERVGRAGKVNVSLVRSEGRTSFRIAYRVLLEYPPLGGQAAALVTIDPHDGIGARALQAAERVCDTAGYRGLANVEFYLQDDGTLCLLEVNARVWGSVWLPERLGLRPVERAVLEALGEDVPAPLDYPAGRRFHRPSLEGRWLVAPSRDRGPVTRLLQVARPWDVYNLVSLTDPLPLAVGIRRMASLAGTQLTRRRDRRSR